MEGLLMQKYLSIMLLGLSYHAILIFFRAVSEEVDKLPECERLF